MGNTQQCMYCKETEQEINPILEIHSRGKYRGKFICFKCIKIKIDLIKQKLNDNPDEI